MEKGENGWRRAKGLPSVGSFPITSARLCVVVEGTDGAGCDRSSCRFAKLWEFSGNRVLDCKSLAWGKKTAFRENAGKPHLHQDRSWTISLLSASSISACIAGMKFHVLMLSCHQEGQPFPQLWHESIWALNQQESEGFCSRWARAEGAGRGEIGPFQCLQHPGWFKHWYPSPRAPSPCCPRGVGLRKHLLWDKPGFSCQGWMIFRGIYIDLRYRIWNSCEPTSYCSSWELVPKSLGHFDPRSLNLVAFVSRRFPPCISTITFLPRARSISRSLVHEWGLASFQLCFHLQILSFLITSKKLPWQPVPAPLWWAGLTFRVR